MSKENKISCLLVQAGCRCSRVTVDVSDYRNMAKAIECDYIETATRSFKGEPYLIVCDEEGKLKGGNKTTIVTCDGWGRACETFVGDCLVMRVGFKSLRECDYRRIIATKTPVTGNKIGDSCVLLCSVNGNILY